MEIRAKYRIGTDRDKLRFTPMEDSTFSNVMKLFKSRCSYIETDAFLFNIMRAISVAEETGNRRIYMHTIKDYEVLCDVMIEVEPSERDIEVFRNFDEMHGKLLKRTLMTKPKKEACDGAEG